jgi:hypothetical protein
MSYEAVDNVISAWAVRHGLTLNTEFGSQPRRFCYVSAGKAECFQVSIEPPKNGIITVNAWDVETHHDAEFHRAWQAQTSLLEPTLDAALKQIADWAARPRNR